MSTSRLALFLLWFALGSALTHTRAARAEVPPELHGQPVRAVEIYGESATIAGEQDVGIAVGDTLSRALVRGSVLKLLETGLWTDVQLDAVPMQGGVRLVVRLKPRITLGRVSVGGTSQIEEQTVLDALRVSKGSQISMPQLQELSRRVARVYAERGYLAAQISVRLRDTDDPSRKVLMVEIEEGSPARVADVRFEGASPANPTALRKAMGIHPGDVLDRRALADGSEQGQLYLRRLGHLEARLDKPLVTVSSGQAHISVPGHIGPRYRVAVRGAWPLNAADVRGVLDLQQEGLTATGLRRGLRERVQDLYRRHGYADTKVSVRRLPDTKKGRFVLLVEIDPGKVLRVVAITFAGAKHFERDYLRDQVHSYLEEDLPGSGFVSPVDSDTASAIHSGDEPRHKRQVPRPLQGRAQSTYYEPTYKDAITHITELYQAEGYLEAKVGPANLKRIGKDRAAVSIPVTEGPRTLLHSVRIRGTKVVSKRELLTVSGLRQDDPFSYVRLEEARIRMQDHYHEEGYMFVRVVPGVRFSPDRTRAQVSIEVVERFQVHVSDIVVQGAERTNEGFIKALLSLDEGDVFRPSKAKRSEEDLQALGVFSGVDVKMMDPELPAREKHVLVTVNERRNQYLDVSAGVSTGQGARAGFEYGYRNLFGSAVGLSLRVQLATRLFFFQDQIRERYDALPLVDRLERRISLGLVVPRVPGMGRVRTNLDLTHLRNNERDFGMDQNSVGLTFTFTGIRRMAIALGSDLENSNVDLFVGGELNDYLQDVNDPRIRRLLRVPEGESTLIAPRLTVSYDRRDSPFSPTKGFFASAGVEFDQTLDSEVFVNEDGSTTQFFSQFMRLSAGISGYWPIFSKVVVAGQARIGRVVHLSDRSETYPNRAFFMGGFDTMRGYFEDSMIPQDLAQAISASSDLTPNSVVRSGDTFMLLRLELRFPIYDQLRGGIFTDIGNLWKDASKLDPLQLRPTGGLGLRLSTPVGPIALDYGFIFMRRRALGEPFGSLHFSIGLF